MRAKSLAEMQGYQKCPDHPHAHLHPVTGRCLWGNHFPLQERGNMENVATLPNRQSESEIDRDTGELPPIPGQVSLFDMPCLVQYKGAEPKRVHAVVIDGVTLSFEEGDSVTVKCKDGMLLKSVKSGWRAE